VTYQAYQQSGSLETCSVEISFMRDPSLDLNRQSVVLASLAEIACKARRVPPSQSPSWRVPQMGTHHPGATVKLKLVAPSSLLS
jgi:hypothetical protein